MDNLKEISEWSMKLEHPFGMMISGPSSCGKTFFVKELITHLDSVISKPIENIVYVYDCWQNLYDELLKLRPITFIQGIPNNLADDELLPVNKNNLLIVDDLMNDACKNTEMENVFTKYIHHRNLSAVYLVQNLFCQGKSSRTIALNASYLVLFKSPRDNNQITVLARQMYPGRRSKYFLEAFKNATEKPYGYLLVDYKARTPDAYRLRTEIFSLNQVVYLQKRY